jgi:hypothetical protein
MSDLSRRLAKAEAAIGPTVKNAAELSWLPSPESGIPNCGVRAPLLTLPLVSMLPSFGNSVRRLWPRCSHGIRATLPTFPAMAAMSSSGTLPNTGPWCAATPATTLIAAAAHPKTAPDCRDIGWPPCILNYNRLTV